MYLSYRRNLNGIPETNKREMYKKAYIDRWPELAKLYAMGGSLDDAINRDIEANEPYEEVLMR